MQRLADKLFFSPTDLNDFIECEYLTRLDLDVANGRVLEKRRLPEADLLAAKGDEHERRQLDRFEQEGRRVARIADPWSSGWEETARETSSALTSGADVVYQGVFVGGDWRGKADFLVRTDVPSALGVWSYEVWDSKLARHPKPSHILQLTFYSEHLSELQGLEPEWMRLVLGTGEQLPFKYRDFCSYFRIVRDRFVRSVQQDVAVSPYPVAHCSLCGYLNHCEEHWTAVDHLSLVAGIRRGQIERLADAGVTTCAGLGLHTGALAGVGTSAIERLRHQARLQTHFRETGEHRYDLLPPSEENGFRLLPPPSPGDVFFDMEGYPFFDPTGGLEYLFGAVTAESGRAKFQALRGLDRAGEKRAFEEFIDFVWARLERWPDLHIYHYAQYEPTTLKRLMTVHATREEEVDALLRREAFVDLYQVVRRSIRISHDNYSIKAVRQFFMPEAGRGEVAGGSESMIEFQRFIDTGDESILDAIERYNEEDCVSTFELRGWLLERKREAEERFRVELSFRASSSRGPDESAPEVDRHADLRARLSAIPKPWVPLLNHLLYYHRREAKPEWWAYFDRRKKSLDELLEDTDAVAYLSPVGEPQPVDRSFVYTLAFPPQEFRLKVDTSVEGPLGEGRVGSIEWIDASGGRLGLRRSRNQAAKPLPDALIVGGPVSDTAQRNAIVRVAEAATREHSPYSAIEDILQCAAPRFRPTRPGVLQTLDLELQRQLVTALDHSYLFIQGPPGSGKNKDCEQSTDQLIAGTAWLFARDGMDQTLDYLFIDEAGQTALADAVAVGASAHNIVLLGDPQQLPHVTQNSHPAGSGCSVLEHLLGDTATVAEDRGLFLSNSWRMHPEVCRFVSELSYDGRLASAPGCELQQVSSSGLTGVGPRYLPVEHRDNSQRSQEEAQAIAREIARLLDGKATVTDRHGRTTALTAADILVVAPYNMQVRTIREVVQGDVEVGTVDKFQGREAAIVFFSMTSSTGDEVPAGLEFLFNQNRLNVAVSRAKCMPVIVCSPRLLETKCATAEQMRLVNAVCRFKEVAAHVDS